MVLLDEEPHKLISHCVDNFNISGDMESLARCKEDLSKVAAMRTKILEDSRNSLRTLARKLDIIQQSVDAYDLDAAKREHVSKIHKLERETYSIAKNINELESSSHHLESHLARLKEELEQADSDDAMESAALEAEDGTLLKLKVYRSLGIDIQEDGAGGYNKAVIRNSAKGDVHVVNIEKKFSQYFYANYFWNNL